VVRGCSGCGGIGVAGASGVVPTTEDLQAIGELLRRDPWRITRKVPDYEVTNRIVDLVADDRGFE
jgi:hypothetical protein